MSTNFFFFISSLALLYVAYTIPKHEPKQTNLVVYVHDYFTGHDTSAITIAGKSGFNSHILQFGTLAVVDDPVTEGPRIESREIGRAQGTYINSQLDGKGLYMVFSIIFTDGEYKGSTLEIQGSDIFSRKEREFGIVSGTGYFRFVKGFGIMQTEFMDIPNLRAIIKLNDVFYVRNLSLVYTLAGVDCIECAADESVVSAVNEGIEAVKQIVQLRRTCEGKTILDRLQKCDKIRARTNLVSPIRD